MASSIITSIVTGGTNSHATVSEEANAIYTDFVTQGVVGTVGNTSSVSPSTGGFAVNQDASPDMGVTVTAGVATITTTPANQDSQVLRARMSTNYTSYTINANSTGSTVYDWIYLSVNATNANNPAVDASDVTSIVTSRSTSQSADNGTPPTYGILLAVITVINGATSITNPSIRDGRSQSTLNVGTSSTNGWQTLPFPLTYASNTGNKEFTVTTPNDLTGTLNAGMKLKLSRSVTPPTQCMSFTSSSSQYATKSSPAGLTFTSAFTCEAWVKVSSRTGQQQMIVNMYNSAGSTGGWYFRLTSTLNVEVGYGTTSSFTNFVSAASLPLGRWVHIAGVVSSTSSKTGAVYIDGLLTPSTSTVTAATSLTQSAVDLRVGAASSTPTNTYFSGELSEVRVWSVAQSTSSIQNKMTINAVGSETNLVALFEGNGNFNDSTSNANNLTQSGGASAAQNDNPFNSTEYAVITNVSYSNPTTTVTLFTGGNGNIPNQTLNNPYYSVVKSPFGFPSAYNQWSVVIHNGANTLVNPGGTATFINDKSLAISVPIGMWRLRFEGFLSQSNGSSGVYAPYGGLSTAPTSSSDPDFIGGFVGRPGSTGGSQGEVVREKNISLTSDTIYYVVAAYQVGGGTVTIGFDGSIFLTTVRAVCAYI